MTYAAVKPITGGIGEDEHMDNLTSSKSVTKEKGYIGEFEELVLLSIHNLMPNAHGTSIKLLLENSTGRTVTVGALYATLDRLERKGFVNSWLDDPTPERGGRKKRLFEINDEGHKILRDAEAARRKLVPKLQPT